MMIVLQESAQNERTDRHTDPKRLLAHRIVEKNLALNSVHRSLFYLNQLFRPYLGPWKAVVAWLHGDGLAFFNFV